MIFPTRKPRGAGGAAWLSDRATHLIDSDPHRCMVVGYSADRQAGASRMTVHAFAVSPVSKQLDKLLRHALRRWGSGALRGPATCKVGRWGLSDLSATHQFALRRRLHGKPNAKMG